MATAGQPCALNQGLLGPPAQLRYISTDSGDDSLRRVCWPEKEPAKQVHGLDFSVAANFGDGLRRYHDDLSITSESIEKCHWRKLLGSGNNPMNIG